MRPGAWFTGVNELRHPLRTQGRTSFPDRAGHQEARSAVPRVRGFGAWEECEPKKKAPVYGRPVQVRRFQHWQQPGPRDDFGPDGLLLVSHGRQGTTH